MSPSSTKIHISPPSKLTRTSASLSSRDTGEACSLQAAGPGARLLNQPGCYSGAESWLQTKPTGLFNKLQKEYEVIVCSQRQANLKDDRSKGILVPTLSAAVTAEVGQEMESDLSSESKADPGRLNNADTAQDARALDGGQRSNVLRPTAYAVPKGTTPALCFNVK